MFSKSKHAAKQFIPQPDFGDLDVVNPQGAFLLFIGRGEECGQEESALVGEEVEPLSDRGGEWLPLGSGLER
jgi:hypothetical protein